MELELEYLLCIFVHFTFCTFVNLMSLNLNLNQWYVSTPLIFYLPKTGSALYQGLFGKEKGEGGEYGMVQSIRTQFNLLILNQWSIALHCIALHCTGMI